MGRAFRQPLIAQTKELDHTRHILRSMDVEADPAALRQNMVGRRAPGLDKLLPDAHRERQVGQAAAVQVPDLVVVELKLDAAEAMANETHAIVAFAHVSNVLGSILDAKRAAEIAHRVGAKLLLDGCQAAPRLSVDVAAIGCDYYAFSAHKLYGPTGIGVLWGRKELLDAMPPYQGGGAMIDRVTFERTTFLPPPARVSATRSW